MQANKYRQDIKLLTEVAGGLSQSNDLRFAKLYVFIWIVSLLSSQLRVLSPMEQEQFSIVLVRRLCSICITGTATPIVAIWPKLTKVATRCGLMAGYDN